MKISQRTNLSSEMEVIKVANKNEDLRKANKAKKMNFTHNYLTQKKN